jgi:hypothetical protein|uniref:Uncharacterized protein n=1 Tax=viral metagenome TaxID=1070528 RepID=A0A6C0EBV9_9ZZZZ
MVFLLEINNYSFYENKSLTWTKNNLVQNESSLNANDEKPIQCIYHLPKDLISILDNPFTDLEMVYSKKKYISSVDYFKRINQNHKK